MSRFVQEPTDFLRVYRHSGRADPSKKMCLTAASDDTLHFEINLQGVKVSDDPLFFNMTFFLKKGFVFVGELRAILKKVDPLFDNENEVAKVDMLVRVDLEGLSLLIDLCKSFVVRENRRASFFPALPGAQDPRNMINDIGESLLQLRDASCAQIEVVKREQTAAFLESQHIRRQPTNALSSSAVFPRLGRR